MDDFDFDDDEGSDHQDYDANYFDNGEGDDDSGGEEGESRFLSSVNLLSPFQNTSDGLFVASGMV